MVMKTMMMVTMLVFMITCCIINVLPQVVAIVLVMLPSIFEHYHQYCHY